MWRHLGTAGWVEVRRGDGVEARGGRDAASARLMGAVISGAVLEIAPDRPWRFRLSAPGPQVSACMLGLHPRREHDRAGLPEPGNW
jgi:hypothetical protein